MNIEDYDTIVAVGGDGTVFQIINAIMEKKNDEFKRNISLAP